jgi:ATP-binding cassette, subfamily A (ABC1), member 1
MDPAARRYLWTIIKKARDFGMTIVLTTHRYVTYTVYCINKMKNLLQFVFFCASMEECEALSTKLGIMVNGQFKCFGSVQHLKNKYGNGYTLILKCKSTSDKEADIKKLEEFVSEKIYFSKLKDKQEETLFYQIEYDAAIIAKMEKPESALEIQSIAELFTIIEENKEQLKLETYSLSQTTLENIFLTFAREQNENESNYDELEEGEEGDGDGEVEESQRF